MTMFRGSWRGDLGICHVGPTALAVGPRLFLDRGFFSSLSSVGLISLEDQQILQSSLCFLPWNLAPRRAVSSARSSTARAARSACNLERRAASSARSSTARAARSACNLERSAERDAVRSSAQCRSSAVSCRCSSCRPDRRDNATPSWLAGGAIASIRPESKRYDLTADERLTEQKDTVFSPLRPFAEAPARSSCVGVGHDNVDVGRLDDGLSVQNVGRFECCPAVANGHRVKSCRVPKGCCVQV